MTVFFWILSAISVASTCACLYWAREVKRAAAKLQVSQAELDALTNQLRDSLARNKARGWY